MVHVNQKWGATDKSLLASHPVWPSLCSQGGASSRVAAMVLFFKISIIELGYEIPFKAKRSLQLSDKLHTDWQSVTIAQMVLI